MPVQAVKERYSEVIDMLPNGVRSELYRLIRSRRGGAASLRELRLRAGGVCTAFFERECVTLLSSPTQSEMEELLTRACDGALYAHRDSICSGYVTVGAGVRIGVAGTARYDSASVVGISDIRYALIRFPGDVCHFGDELCRAWEESEGGMLIYSPPGVGKTTALRHLARSIGRAPMPRQVCIVDERFEFCEDDFLDSEVDILKGYKRRAGLEIATRTMSPEVVIIDEIGGDDASGISEVVRCGIPLIASAHAGSYDELMSKPSLEPLLRCGAFETFVGISRRDGDYALTVDRA